MGDREQGRGPRPEQVALHQALQRTFGGIRRCVVRCDWEGVEESFRGFCGDHADLIPQWFVDEYIFQAMRLWADGHPDQALRHFGSFINRAAGTPLVDEIGESELLRLALAAPDERPPPKPAKKK